MVDDSKQNLFRKFLRDECSPEEVNRLLEYLQNSEDDTIYHPLMDEVWSKLREHPVINRKEKEQQFQRILNRSRTESVNKPKVKPLFGRLKVAASLVGFLLLSSMVYLLLFQSPSTTYRTGFGETMTLRLPDGSDVVLNSNSSIRYGTDWDAHEAREVFLEGEAFFSVVHTQDDQKFVVTTADEVSVEVLGTRFNVHNRRNATEVVLNEGKVQVHLPVNHEKPDIVMEPGELVTYSQATRQFQKKVINPETYTSWKDNMLIFEDQPLQEIAYSLEDTYGYTIRFDDEKIGKYQFTGTIPRDKIEILFTMLTKSFDLNIEKNGNDVLIASNP